MPKALTIGSAPSAGAFKRQRSADSRDLHTRRTSASQRWATEGQLKPNVRVPAYLEKTKSEISSTFQDLEWKQRFRLFHAMENPQSSPFRVDRSNVVIARNRYGNVQPWDQSRIKLKIPIGGSDYVNASPIVLKRQTGIDHAISRTSKQDQIFTESKYIATQGPKADQLSHFWYMVHQETTGSEGAIVMLTQCYEAGKEKCAVYFPTSLENPILELHHDHDTTSSPETGSTSGEDKPAEQTTSTQTSLSTVTLISASHDSSIGCDVRVLDVTIAKSTKRIHHFLFNGWPDFGRPEAEDRVALLNLTRRSFAVANGSPRIVHCSAGVGRTGTFVALDFLVREIEEGRFIDNKLYPYLKSPTYQIHPDHANAQETSADIWGKGGPPKVQTPTMETTFSDESDQQSYRDDLIYSTVNTLREQRMMMVMNELQYALLYEVVREVFWEKYSTPPEGVTVKPAQGSASVDDMRKTKAAKVEGDSSGSDAETEIIEYQDDANVDDDEHRDNDPYKMVAPEHIREGLKKHE